MRRLKYPNARPTPLESELDGLRTGKMTFDQFVRSTAGDWTRLASYLRGRWQVPSAVDVDDVRQEMLLAAWRAVAAWDDTRGVSLRSFVLWTAITLAKKWLHGQRAALRRDDHAPSRHEVTATALGIEPTDDRSSVTGRTEAEQEFTVAGIELFGRVLASIPPTDNVCLQALLTTGGDVASAAGALYSNPTARATLRLKDERDARRAVTRTATRVVSMLTDEVAE